MKLTQIILIASAEGKTFEIVSYYAAKIKQRFEQANDLTELTITQVVTVESLALHALPLLQANAKAHSGGARERNIQQLSNVLDDMKTVSSVMSTTLTESNQRLDSLVDHVEDTDNTIKNTTDRVNRVNKSL
jgi:hypothetical protein